MPASTTSSYSSRSSSKRTITNTKSQPSDIHPHRDQKLLLRAEGDFDETSSVASTSSQRSTSVLSSSSYGSRMPHSTSASLATSYASLRDLELRKRQIEDELARVQQELQMREAQHAARLSSSPGIPNKAAQNRIE